MAGYSNAAEDNQLKLIFQAVNWAAIADNTASAPLTNLFISLHTADPGEAGTQTTSEAAFTGYARVAVARTASGWAVSAGVASNVAAIVFANCTASPGAALTHVAIGHLTTTGGAIIAFGALSASYQPSIGNAPQIAASALTVTVD